MCPLAARGRKAPAPARAPTFPLIPAALLVYRVFRNEAKRATKILHGLLHVFAFIIALVGEFLGSALPTPALLPLLGIPGRDTGCWDKSPEIPASQVSLGSPHRLPSPSACPHVTPRLWSRPGGGV